MLSFMNFVTIYSLLYLIPLLRIATLYPVNILVHLLYVICSN